MPCGCQGSEVKKTAERSENPGQEAVRQIKLGTWREHGLESEPQIHQLLLTSVSLCPSPSTRIWVVVPSPFSLQSWLPGRLLLCSSCQLDEVIASFPCGCPHTIQVFKSSALAFVNMFKKHERVVALIAVLRVKTPSAHLYENRLR